MKWFLLTAAIAIICAGCLTAADIARQNKNVEELKKARSALMDLKKTYNELKEDFLNGRIEMEVWVKKSVVVEDNIAIATKAVETIVSDIQKQGKNSGKEWWTVLLAIGANMLVRGLPSKGPAGKLLNIALPWRKDDR